MSTPRQKPKYHVILAHGKDTKRAKWTGSIVTLHRQAAGAIVRYIPLNKEAWEEVHKIAEDEWRIIAQRYGVEEEE